MKTEVVFEDEKWAIIRYYAYFDEWLVVMSKDNEPLKRWMVDYRDCLTCVFSGLYMVPCHLMPDYIYSKVLKICETLKRGVKTGS